MSHWNHTLWNLCSRCYICCLQNYSLLSSISAWARSPDGAKSLASYNPPLRPADYSMIALLAGTRTSPERKFPAYATRKEGADERKTYSDRRAVTNVFNALLSIGGAGAATWWAAGRLDWKDEWKALLSLAVALIVAASEVVLYLIWDSRRSQPPRPLSHRSAARIEPSESKKAQEVSPDSSVDSDAASGEVGPMSTAVANTRGSANLRERTTAGQPPDS
ncbi:uncharacterized protein C8Q71DRAFT_361893 [Rhodofomes roseus]|uniref:Uncharacterized protein n=1 Tax=Rhodofomes roseus TaxID=34475 RepID=A0ABQ8K1N6_9APHY|nr:uncharacterized protein C8Q71DRAFT_361893 [Rhodofomes roseus]KAH9830642.1 hypothetical protein C8Q71DRAFT_361893 [Rhodofomes roseus]